MNRPTRKEFMALSEKQQDELIDGYTNLAKNYLKVILKYSLYTLGVALLFFFVIPLGYYIAYTILSKFM